ncbi:hypothetical protein L1887_58140 [Cichorium endivia]|nr:hypothetical protein L1887_58140 [Cichorium endivia]
MCSEDSESDEEVDAASLGAGSALRKHSKLRTDEQTPKLCRHASPCALNLALPLPHFQQAVRYKASSAPAILNLPHAQPSVSLTSYPVIASASSSFLTSSHHTSRYPSGASSSSASSTQVSRGPLQY